MNKIWDNKHYLEDNNLDLEEIKKSNPKTWFQEVLSDKDFEKLDELNVKSKRKIAWDILIKDWTCDIENWNILSITWPNDLDLWITNLTSLRKLKEVKWNLDLRYLMDIKNLWILEKVWWDLKFGANDLDSLWNIKKVWWKLIFDKSNIQNLWKLEEVGSCFIWKGIKITDLWKLKKVWWYLELSESDIIDLWWLEKVWWDLYLRDTNIESLWKLKEVWYSFILNNSNKLHNLWNLEKIWNNCDLTWTKIKSLWKLKKVWWCLYIKDTCLEFQLEVIDSINKWTLEVDWEVIVDSYLEKYLVDIKYHNSFKKNNPKNWLRKILDIKEFKELERLNNESKWKIDWKTLATYWVCDISDWKVLWIIWSKNLELKWTDIEDLWKIKEIKWNLELQWTPLKSLGKLKIIEWNLFLKNTKLIDLWDLDEITWQLNLIGSKLSSLWKVRIVWWSLDLSYSWITDLWIIEKIWWNFHLEWIKIQEYWKVRKIWWYLYIKWLDIESQLVFIEKIKNNILSVTWTVFILDNLDKFFIDNRLNFDNFITYFWDNYNNIIDSKLRILFKSIINIGYKMIMQEISDKLKNVWNINELIEINKQINNFKEKITSFWLKIEWFNINSVIN